MRLEIGKYYKTTAPRLIEQDLKKEWTAALRSDKYKGRQGKNMLKTPEGNFCCLGVVCDMFGIRETKRVRDITIYQGENQPSTWLLDTEVSVFGHNGPTGSHTLLPVDFTPFHVDNPSGIGPVEWRGSGYLFSVAGQNEFGGEKKAAAYSLPGLNDMGFTFAQIADIIDYFL